MAKFKLIMRTEIDSTSETCQTELTTAKAPTIEKMESQSNTRVASKTIRYTASENTTAKMAA